MALFVTLLLFAQTAVMAESSAPVHLCARAYPDIQLRDCARVGRIVPFSSLELPITRADAEVAIQALAQQGYGTAFRYLGYREDWDHGHLLISTADHKAKAIVFHTQEKYIPYRLYVTNKKLAEELYHGMYDGLLQGLDRTVRSWIYFLDDHRLELARNYVLDKRPNSIYEDLWQGYIAANTYTTANLDSKKLGFPFDEFAQINFNRMDCDYLFASKVADPNVLQIFVPGSQSICVHVSWLEKARPQ